MTAVKLTKIRNSKGIRLNKDLLNRYKFGDFIEVDELPDGLLLKAPIDQKLSWEETYKEMAESDEDWSDWDVVIYDGLNDDEQKAKIEKFAGIADIKLSTEEIMNLTRE